MDPFRVLIVDDEPDIAEAIRLGFEVMMEGVEARVASNGREALEMLRAERFDMILSDYKMPEMDGVAFLAIAQKEFPHVPRVMLTAYPDADVAARAVEDAGVGLFISKPFQGDYLVHLVKALQDRS